MVEFRYKTETYEKKSVRYFCANKLQTILGKIANHVRYYLSPYAMLQ